MQDKEGDQEETTSTRTEELEQQDMSSRKARQDVKAGLQHMEGMVDNLIDRHLIRIEKPRNKIGVVIGFCVHLLVLAFTIVMVWTAKPSSSLFSWHPTLMTLAFVVLMPEALLLFSPWSSPVPSPHSSKVRWHWLFQVGMAVSAATGFIVITANKMLNGAPHYTSWHGLLGVYLLAAMTFQLSGGLLHMYPEIMPFKVRMVTMKRLHALFGTLMFTVGMGVVCLGLYSSWCVTNMDENLWVFCALCLGATQLYVLVQVLRNYVWR